MSTRKTPTTPVPPYTTPPELAAVWRCKPEKIIGFIRRGELRAVNIANPGRRARWVISPEAIEDFEQRRAATPTPKQKPRPRHQLETITRFFR